MSQFAHSTILAILFLPSLSTLLNLWTLFSLQKERQRINETLFDVSLHLKNLSTRYNKKFNDLASTVQALEAEAHETGRMFKNVLAHLEELEASSHEQAHMLADVCKNLGLPAEDCPSCASSVDDGSDTE